MSRRCLTHLPKDRNRSGSEMLCHLFNFYPAGVVIKINFSTWFMEIGITWTEKGIIIK